MEIRGIEISGLPAIDVRNALRKFIHDDSGHSFKDGEYIYTPKRLTANFFATCMNIDVKLAESLLNVMIADEYIDGQKLVPTIKGMALCHAEDRDRMDLASAEVVLKKFLEAVDKENARPNARIFVERVSVFGSFERCMPTVGDIDLILEVPLPHDCQPEDMQEREDLVSRLRISEYLSFHNELDYVACSVNNKLLYDRVKHS